MLRLLLAGVIGGVIVFALAAMQNVVLPAAEPRSLPAEDAIRSVLRASVHDAGFYFFPGPSLTRTMTSAERQAAMAEHERRFREGPTGVLVYAPGGTDFRFGRRLMTQLILSLAAALVAAGILTLTAGATPYATRVGVVALLGVFAFLYIEPQYWNWYGFPASYTIARVCGGIVSWTIAGTAMAAIVR